MWRVWLMLFAWVLLGLGFTKRRGTLAGKVLFYVGIAALIFMVISYVID